MIARLGWGAVVIVAVAAAFGASAVVAQDKDGGAAKPAVRKELRAGDEVDVVVTCRAKVAADGSISVVGLGKFEASGRTVDELRAAMTKQASAVGVTCDVRTAPRTVYVIGAVSGSVELPAGRSMRILEVLAKASEFESGRDADFSHVTVRRTAPGGTPFTFEVNVDDILDRNREEQNIVVFEGDVVIVSKAERSDSPSAGWVYVIGQVQSPGRHQIVKSRTPFTLTKLIVLCGDFQTTADRRRVRVVRRGAGTLEQIDVDFEAIVDGRAKDFDLRPDDVIYVETRK